MINRLLTYGFLLFICFTNCVSPYDFSPNEAGEYLVINGGINQLDEINRIRLTLSTPYETFSNARPIEDAEIMLVNSRDEKEPFYFEGEGWYAHYGAQIRVEAGESYHIEITYLNQNYRTDPQLVPTPIIADSVGYHVGFVPYVNKNGNVVTNESIEIYINTPINQGEQISYLRWKVDESWLFVEESCYPLHIPKACYMSGGLSTDQIFIYSSENIASNYLSGKLVAQKINPRRIEFTTKHYFNVYQLTISEDTYAYWQKVVQLANPQGDIFDLPPAPLKGNVYNVENPNEIILGYFEVSGKSIARRALYKLDIDPLKVPLKETICRYWGDYFEECCNCLNFENSSTERPAFWD